MKTLEQARAYWERGGEIVGHWEFKRNGYTLFRVTLIRECNHGESYHLIRYFEMSASGWVASCDLQKGTGADAFARLAQLLDGVREGEE